MSLYQYVSTTEVLLYLASSSVLKYSQSQLSGATLMQHSSTVFHTTGSLERRICEFELKNFNMQTFNQTFNQSVHAKGKVILQKNSLFYLCSVKSKDLQ